MLVKHKQIAWITLALLSAPQYNSAFFLYLLGSAFKAVELSKKMGAQHPFVLGIQGLPPGDLETQSLCVHSPPSSSSSGPVQTHVIVGERGQLQGGGECPPMAPGDRAFVILFPLLGFVTPCPRLAPSRRVCVTRRVGQTPRALAVAPPKIEGHHILYRAIYYVKTPIQSIC